VPASSRSSAPARPARRAHRRRQAVSAWPPRWLSPLAGGDSDGPLVGEFIESFCRIDKDSVGGRRGELLVLRPWQRQLLAALFERRDDGRLAHRQALVGVPRKNGKSALASGIALYGLLAAGDGAEVYGCGGDREQARIVFRTAKRMVRMDPELASMVDAGEIRLFKDAIEVPATDSIYRVLSSVADLQEGLNPSLVVFDEVHVQPDDELWNVMALAQGARLDPLMVGITTAGVRTDRHGHDTLCYRLYKHGRDVAVGKVDDPSFFFAWWEPTAGVNADYRDPAVWAESNPGFGDLVDPDDFASVIKRTAEPEVRTKRTNVFVSAETTWLPFGAWHANKRREQPPRDTRIVVGFDGSKSRDSSVLVGATVEADPAVFLIRAWERPLDERGRPAGGWKVDRNAVKDEIRAACIRWDVAEVAHDPYLWVDAMDELEADGVPVVEFPQNGQRMSPACEDFRAAVIDRRLPHDGSEVLARHLDNAVTHTDRTGTRIEKQTKDSLRTVDAAVAAVMARARAAWHAADLAAGDKPVFAY